MSVKGRVFEMSIFWRLPALGQSVVLLECCEPVEMIEVLAGEHSSSLKSQCPLLRGSPEILPNLVQFELSLEERNFLGLRRTSSKSSGDRSDDGVVDVVGA